MIQLIIFRAIQGIGGGGILTLSMIISGYTVCPGWLLLTSVSDVVTLQDRGKFQGIIGGVVACGNSLGPIIGALFSEKVSWR